MSSVSVTVTVSLEGFDIKGFIYLPEFLKTGLAKFCNKWSLLTGKERSYQQIKLSHAAPSR